MRESIHCIFRSTIGKNAVHIRFYDCRVFKRTSNFIDSVDNSYTMQMILSTIYLQEAFMYFEKPGKVNTEETLKLAYDRGKSLGLNEVVVASTKGDTACKALEIFKGFNIVSVTYYCGFKEPFKKVMSDDVKKDLERQGVTVVSATHALSGVERSLAKKYSGSYPVLLVADTLRLFGQGTKVAVEISIMAADAGTLTGNDIISIGGSSRGADTALVLKPANQSDLFDMRVREIVCKPRDF